MPIMFPQTSRILMRYTVKEANPDSLNTMHSTKRVRISLSHCVCVLKNEAVRHRVLQKLKLYLLEVKLEQPPFNH